MNFKKIITLGLSAVLACSSLCAKTKYISPNNDGVQDTLEIPVSISEKRYIQAWSLIILDSEDNIVRTISNKISLPETIEFKSFFRQVITPKEGVAVPSTITWDGLLESRETAPDGVYYYYLTATDDNGNVGQTKRYKVIVDTVAPQVSVRQPADKTFGEGSKLSIKFGLSGSVEDKWTGYIKDADGNVVKTYIWEKSAPSDFSWFGTNDDGIQVPDGVYSFEITSTDKAGNHAPETSVTNIIYSANKPATNIYIEGSRYFSPLPESVNPVIQFSLIIPVPDERTGNSLVEWQVAIESTKNRKVVRTYNQEKNGLVPPSSIIFDGLDNDGLLLADGEYKATVTARYSNGYVPVRISSPVIVLDTKKPEAQITISDKIFGGTAKDAVTFTILKTPDNGSPVPSWLGTIKTFDGSKVVKSYDFGEYLPQSVTWNGITDDGSLADDASYVMELAAVDLAGNAGGGKTNDSVRFDTSKIELMLTASDSSFSPNGNNVKDTITFTPVTTTKDVDVYQFNVLNNSGKVVYTNSGDRRLPVEFVWDGKGNDRIICADGIYSAQLIVTTSNGERTEAVTQSFELDTVYPSLSAVIPWSNISPDGDSNQDTIPVTIVGCSKENIWTAEIRDSSDRIIKKYTWNNYAKDYVWDGTDESGNIAPDGNYSMILYSVDDAGNSFSTEIKDVVLDSRETKAYITSEYEGISPNGDGILDCQKFAITASVPDGIKAWKFSIVSANGVCVYSLSEKDSADLPSEIIWNGADNEGNVQEGTFTGTLTIDYLKGNKVAVASTPFICTTEAPRVAVQTYPLYFSPDNDGVDDDLYIRLTGTTKAKIASWSFTINDPYNKPFWRTAGTNAITERIIWDGLSNIQKDINGNPELVQSAMDYPYEFVVTDNLGMTSVFQGLISVDVLVIRDGNVLKMAVPSIIFESDAANFQNANNKLQESQIKKNLNTLNRIAEILKKFKDYKVEIVGHANRITNPYNEAEEWEDNPVWGRASTPLSAERADAIKAYLVKRGVSASNVTTTGRGGTQPIADPYDPDNKWKNRRVEFILVK